MQHNPIIHYNLDNPYSRDCERLLTNFTSQLSNSDVFTGLTHWTNSFLPGSRLSRKVIQKCRLDKHNFQPSIYTCKHRFKDGFSQAAM